MGCVKDAVVYAPLETARVHPGLMLDPGGSVCKLPRRETYDPGEYGDFVRCVEADRKAIYERLIGLQTAVRAREKLTAKAVAAARI